MFGSAVLDIAIGMVFVYLLLSLICSAVNEMIEAGLRNRAKDLAKGIRNLLADEQLANKFYDHALVQALFVKKGKLPSYIPSQTFAMTLLNIIAPDSLPPNQGTTAPVDPNPLKTLRDKISSFSLSGAEGTAAAVDLAPIKQALLALVDDAQGSVAKFRTNLEGWFDASMDRVSGWYKRRVQVIILILGFGVAISLNADTTYIAQRLATDPALRTKVAVAAEEFADAEKAARESANKPPANGQAGTPETSAAANAQMAEAKKKFEKNVADVKNLGLPLGWEVDGSDEHLRWPGFRLWQAGVPTAWYQQLRFHWLGWLLTAFAISLGAPFWFDLLNRLIVVRSTVKPKEKSGVEPSKS